MKSRCNDWEVRFRRSLGFWTMHCVINVLPGFFMALLHLGLWKSPGAVVAMVVAVALFIPLVAALTSLHAATGSPGSLVTRGIRMALALRSAMCAFTSLLLLILYADDHNPIGRLMLFSPDLWAGLGGGLAVLGFTRFAGYGEAVDGMMAGNAGFFLTFALSCFTGLILAFLVFIMSFVCMLLLQMKERKSRYAGMAGERQVAFKRFPKALELPSRRSKF